MTIVFSWVRVDIRAVETFGFIRVVVILGPW